MRKPIDILSDVLVSLGKLLPDGLYVGGMAAIIYGVSLLNVPAAWIVAGVFALVSAYLATRVEVEP